MTDYEPDEVVRVLLGTNLIEGTIESVEKRVGLRGAEDRVRVNVGDGTIVVPPAQLKRS